MDKWSINRVILVGRLGRDPETQYGSSGMAVAKFSLATNDTKKGDNGWEDVTDWHNIVCFGKTAEYVGNYISKGTQVIVEGKLKTSNWEDKDGNKRYKTEVLANLITPVGDKPSSSSSSQGSAPSKGAPEKSDHKQGSPPAKGGGGGSDLPF